MLLEHSSFVRLFTNGAGIRESKITSFYSVPQELFKTKGVKVLLAFFGKWLQFI